MKKIFNFIRSHKIISLIVLGVVFYGAYFVYQKMNQEETTTTYSTATAEKGMLISSISGTGQVSASNQVEINPKVSGELVALNAKEGEEVKEGDLLAQVDSRSALRTISDAKSSLENAKLELEELLAPVDTLTLIQAQNSLEDAKDSLTKLKTTQVNEREDAQESKEKAEDNLEEAYEDAYNNISSAFLDLPDVITGLYTILFSDEISESEVAVSQNSNNYALLNSINDYDTKANFEKYLNKAEDSYNDTKDDYDESFSVYKLASRYSERDEIEDLLEKTLETVKKIADTAKSETNVIDEWVQYRTSRGLKVYSDVSSYQSDLTSYISKTNSHLSSLLSAQNAIEDYKEAIIDAERSIKEMEQNQPLELAAAERSLEEKEQKLIDLEEGAAELEIRNKELTIRQKENSLLEAQNDYADHFVRAPFDGQIAEVGVSNGDSVSSGSSICTLISKQRIAEITLNEIDASQVEVGQRVTLTFDAIEDLSITGEVVEVDTLGTVNQGVVSYDIKIAFDVQDERVKPGMSVSVNIIVESKTNVLLVPLNSVKTSGDENYVEVMVDGKLQRKKIIVGSSNDTMIEVIDGLEEGEEIITQTITTGSQNGSSQQNQNQGPGGGMMRMF